MIHNFFLGNGKINFVPIKKVTVRMESKKKDPILTAVDIFNAGYELCVNETYELMNTKSFVSAGILFVVCVLLTALAIFISPNPKFTIIKKPEGTEERTKALSLAIRYKNLKFYHRAITYGIQSNVQKKPLLIVVSGTIKLKKNGRIEKEQTLEDKPFRLPPKTIVPIFTTGRREVTDIVADLDITLNDGTFDNLYTIWTHENASWIFFNILIRSVSFFTALYLGFHLLTRLASLKNKSPTYTQRFLMIASFILSIFWLPLPELRYFDLLKSFTPLISLLENVNCAFLFYIINVVCWNLHFRFTDAEIPFIKRTTFAFFMMCGVLALPKAIRFNDTFYQDILEVWIPAATMAAITLNLIRFPLFLNSNSPEFMSSFLHLFCAVPAMAMMTYATAIRAERTSKLSVFSAMLNTLSYMFIVLVHWPRDDAGADAQYVAAEKAFDHVGQIDDDMKGHLDLDIRAESDFDDGSYYSEEDDDEEED